MRQHRSSIERVEEAQTVRQRLSAFGHRAAMRQTFGRMLIARRTAHRVRADMASGIPTSLYELSVSIQEMRRESRIMLAILSDWAPLPSAYGVEYEAAVLMRDALVSVADNETAASCGAQNVTDAWDAITAAVAQDAAPV